MKKYIFTILKGFVLIGFIILLSTNFSYDKDSTKTMEEVQSKTIENIKLDGLSQQDNLSMKRFLDLDPSQYESVIYYKSNDAMSASEFVLVKFKDHYQQEPFEGYAPQQAELLKNAIIDIHGNYGLYAVKEDANTMNDQFKKVLSEGE